MDQPTTIEPTLDHQRIDQLRTFLTVEAAADVAARRAPTAHRGRRRLLGGVVAATALGVGLFAAAAIGGGPRSGPASVQTAHAVSIEQAAPGWTKVTIADVDADPDAVVAELQAAGIDARRETLPVERDEQGRLLLRSFDRAGEDGHGFSMVGLADTGSAGEGGLAGLTVEAPDADPSPLDDLTGASSEQIEAEFQAYLQGLGAKMGADGSIEVRNDAGLTVVVLTEG